MSYAELLTHPKWTKKRNKILKRDHYTCTCCKKKQDLQVHHTYYLESTPPPWAYPDESLLTLCSACHREYHCTHENIILKQHLSYNPPKVKKKDNRYHKKEVSQRKQDKKRSLAQKVADKKKRKLYDDSHIIIRGKLYKI